MPRRAASRTPKPRRGAIPASAPRARRWLAIAGVVGALSVVAVGAWSLRPGPPVRPGDAAWAEAREALGAGRAARAERALVRASQLDPSDPEPWLLRLELLRVEDRQVEARGVGWLAYESVPEAARRPVLRALTLALLADTPEAVARATLARWVEADPEDVDARVALFRRVAAEPRAGDPDRSARIASLAEIVAARPDHAAAREALVLSLAEAGEPPARGRAVLDAWPEAGRDARYHRLEGRWSLEYEPRDDRRAVASFRLALRNLPHDWKTRYRLARALRNAGLRDEADREAEGVERLREALDPAALGRKLDAAFAKLDDPRSRLDLADLCDRVGLARLAEAWRQDARRADDVPGAMTRGRIDLPRAR